MAKEKNEKQSQSNDLKKESLTETSLTKKAF